MNPGQQAILPLHQLNFLTGLAALAQKGRVL